MSKSYRIVWSDYLRYRAELRGFDLAMTEQILRFGTERYIDELTGRSVAVGKHRDGLVMIPYEAEGDVVTPVTIHATTRQQVRSRVKSGRFRHG